VYSTKYDKTSSEVRNKIGHHYYIACFPLSSGAKTDAGGR